MSIANALKLPLFSSLAGYQSSWIKNDVSAGLAVAAVGLPSAIAYPAIAGLRPETGIYASITPLVAYALFGPSRQLIVGPDAATITIVAAVLGAAAASMSSPESADTAAIASALAIGVGLCCLAARALKLGIIASFLSRPILTGFFTGIAISILVGQIGRFTGLPIKADRLLAPIAELLGQLDAVHLPTFVLASALFVLLQFLRAVAFPIPGPVVAVLLSVAASLLFDLQSLGIAMVGEIPTTLPSLSLPSLAGVSGELLLLGSGAVFLVTFGSGIVTARSFGARAGYLVDANKELAGFGAANIAAGLFGAFPVSASDSRTAVNLAVGGRSQITSLVAAATLVFALLFFEPLLRVLPIPTLGAILASTALSMIDLKSLARLWHINRVEFAFALIALWGPIGLGVLNGIVIAIAATLVYLMRKLMAPRDALLGRIAGREGFYKLHRSPEAAPVPGLTIYSVQGSLLFFNADYVQAQLRSVIEDLPENTRWLLIDASTVPQVDTSAAAMLAEIHDQLRARNVRLAFSGLHSECRELLHRAGLLSGDTAVPEFDSLDQAFEAFSRHDNISVENAGVKTGG